MSATNKDLREGRTAEKNCVAVNEVVALIRDKWTLLILGALSKQKALRYNELQRAVGGISQRMLTLRLKPLEESGLVKRTVFPTIPPRVDYELTALGRSLNKPLRGLLDWSISNQPALIAARRAYAASAQRPTHS